MIEGVYSSSTGGIAAETMLTANVVKQIEQDERQELRTLN